MVESVVRMVFCCAVVNSTSALQMLETVCFLVVNVELLCAQLHIIINYRYRSMLSARNALSVFEVMMSVKSSAEPHAIVHPNVPCPVLV